MSKVTMRRPDARAMAQLLAEQTQTAAGLILRLAWRQGLTREEIQRLAWNDVDFSAHQLRLPDRTIPLETETEDCLRRQVERPDPPTPFVVVSDRRRQQMPPEEQYDVIRTFLEQSGPAYRQDLAALLHVGDRQCALILKHMVEDGRLVQAGQRYALPIREEVLL